MKTILRTKLHWFDFATKEGYKELRTKLKGMGLHEFDAYDMDPSHYEFHAQVKEYDGKDVELDPLFLFQDQWNTVDGCIAESGARIFDWRHYRDSHGLTYTGYWLEQTSEMVETRSQTVRCGYCGKQYTDRKEGEWCEACLGVSYLKEADLPLLQLIAIVNEYKVKRDKMPSKEFIDRYLAISKEAELKHLEASYEKKLECLSMKVEDAKMEYNIFKWLIDNHVPIDNVIWYDHSHELYFGWQGSIPGEEKELITKRMEKFPSKWKWYFK